MSKMEEYISREQALSYPFANGKYDKKNASPDFIRGCESYKEWLESQPAEERTCGNCKWSVGKDKPETYVVCKNKDRYVIPKAVDMFNKGCERWEKE